MHRCTYPTSIVASSVKPVGDFSLIWQMSETLKQNLASVVLWKWLEERDLVSGRDEGKAQPLGDTREPTAPLLRAVGLCQLIFLPDPPDRDGSEGAGQEERMAALHVNEVG